MSEDRPFRLHHHTYVVADQERTRQFYEEIMGFPLVATWCEEDELPDGKRVYCHTFYEIADGGCLAFFQFADPVDQERFAHASPPSDYHHIALQASESMQRAVRARAEAAGLEPITIDHGYCESLYVTDPDGLIVELTVDIPEIADVARERKASAHADLARWLAGDHS